MTVQLLDVFGDDLMIVNAARSSFAKHSDELSERDVKLIEYLASHRHTTPLGIRNCSSGCLCLSTSNGNCSNIKSGWWPAAYQAGMLTLATNTTKSKHSGISQNRLNRAAQACCQIVAIRMH